MNKLIFPAAMLLFVMFSCKDKDGKETPAKGPETKVVLPMEMQYQGTPEIGSNANMVKVMQWNKWMGEGKIDSAASMLADSVNIVLGDGTVFNSTADSIKKVLTGWWSDKKSVDIKYVSALPVNVPEKKHEWVFSWTDETYNLKNGNVDHERIHEDYRMENGKIREIYQYVQAVPAAKK